MEQIEAAGLNDEEMALIIKLFKTALKERKGQPYKNKTKGKRSCFKCGKVGHFIANCPDNDSDQEQGNKREKKKAYKKAKGEAHLGKARPRRRGSAHASSAVRLVILSLTAPIMIVTRKRETRGKRRSITRRQRARRI